MDSASPLLKRVTDDPIARRFPPRRDFSFVHSIGGWGGGGGLLITVRLSTPQTKQSIEKNLEALLVRVPELRFEISTRDYLEELLLKWLGHVSGVA